MQRKTGKREKQPLDVSVEESKRVGLPGGGRKKASKELEINMQGWVISKRACHERVSCKIIRAMAKQMYTTVSDSHDAGWLNHFLLPVPNYRLVPNKRLVC